MPGDVARDVSPDGTAADRSAGLVSDGAGCIVRLVRTEVTVASRRPDDSGEERFMSRLVPAPDVSGGVTSHDVAVSRCWASRA